MRRPALALLLVPPAAPAACGGDRATTASSAPAPTQTLQGGTVVSTRGIAALVDGPPQLGRTGGRCTTGEDEAWLQFDAGVTGGDDFIAFGAGRFPTGDPSERPARGGGVFTGEAFTARRGADVRSSRDARITLAPDLRSGTLTAERVRVTLRCP